MNKSNTILKPYLRKFILQTHPDFFHNDSIKKQTNATSIQKLYNILLPESKAATTATTYKLEFFTKQQREKPKAIVEFHNHDSEWINANTFFQLCKQLDIPILQSDMDIVHDMMSKELNKNKPKYKSLTKEFAERLYKLHHVSTKTTEWIPNQVLNHKLVMFDPDVNKKAATNKLCAWLPQLHAERWWGKIPIMIVSPDSELPPKELTKGILIIKSDMELEDIKTYFDRHLGEIIKENNL